MIKSILRKIGIGAMAFGGAFGAPPPPMKRDSASSGDDKIRPAEDGDIIGNPWTQGMHFPMKEMDDHLGRYMSYEERISDRFGHLVSGEVAEGQHSWQKVGYSELAGICYLRGIRDDGMEFIAQTTFSEDRDSVDSLLCEYLNKFLEVAA